MKVIAIFVLAILYSIGSIYYEIYYEPSKKMKPNTFYMNMILRFLHSFVFVYLIFYIWFNYNAKQIYHFLYVFVLFCIIILWSITDMCTMCLFEWSFYEGNVYERKTTEVLHFNLVDSYLINIVYLISCLMVIYVLKVNPIYKVLIICGLIFFLVITPRNIKYHPIDVRKSIQNNYSPKHIYNSFASLVNNKKMLI